MHRTSKFLEIIKTEEWLREHCNEMAARNRNLSPYYSIKVCGTFSDNHIELWLKPEKSND